MILTFGAVFASIGLFAGMLLLLAVGRRLGARHITLDSQGARAGLGAVEAAVFSLLGLLLAFSFSGAGARFDSRRQLVAEEANYIGTAWLRLDLLPSGAQASLREKFRLYVDSRLAAYRKLPDIEAAKRELAKTGALQSGIWNEAIAASREEPRSAALLLLPALNQMFDIVTTRTVTGFTHPPMIIFAMLAILALAGSLLAGHGMAAAKTPNWLHVLAFACLISGTFFVVVDLEFPRLGLIKVEAFDQVLVDLRQSMH